MNHADHANLLREGGIQPGQVWADLGAGAGAFTLALAELLGDKGTIYAVDRDASALRQQAEPMRLRYPTITAHYIMADFTRPLTLPALNGLMIANALHFVVEQATVVTDLKRYLKLGGRLILIEYNTDQANTWVPRPLSYSSWARLAAHCGFSHTQKISSRPSRFLGEIYSAVSW